MEPPSLIDIYVQSDGPYDICENMKLWVTERFPFLFLTYIEPSEIGNTEDVTVIIYVLFTMTDFLYNYASDFSEKICDC